jgi:hypothetical protein
VRWEALFGDLEAQAESADRAALEAELGDLVRAEFGALSLRGRLGAHTGCDLVWFLADGEPVTGVLLETGEDWVLVRAGAGDVLLPMAAVASVSGLSRTAVADGGPLARSLRLTVVLRGLARDRQAVLVAVAGGAVLAGTIDRVGADHVDVAVHAIDEPRRAGAVTGVRTVPLASIRRVTVPGGGRADE